MPDPWIGPPVEQWRSCLSGVPNYDVGVLSLTQQLVPPQHVESAQRQALVENARAGSVQQVYVVGLWRRITATIVDVVMLAPVLLAAGWIAIRAAGLHLTRGSLVQADVLLELLLSGKPVVYATLVLTIGIALLYGIVFVATTGNTPGLSLLRARVINIYGGRPELWRAVLRSFGILVGMALFGLGLLWIGFDREKRGLHDWLAGTYVVRTRYGKRPLIGNSR